MYFVSPVYKQVLGPIFPSSVVCIQLYLNCQYSMYLTFLLVTEILLCLFNIVRISYWVEFASNSDDFLCLLLADENNIKFFRVD